MKQSSFKVLQLSILFIFLSIVPAFAENVILKSGRVIDGRITERTRDSIKIDAGIGVELTYYFDEIESIDGQNPKTVSVMSFSDKKESDKEPALVIRSAPVSEETPQPVGDTLEAMDADLEVPAELPGIVVPIVEVLSGDSNDDVSKKDLVQPLDKAVSGDIAEIVESELDDVIGSASKDLGIKPDAPALAEEPLQIIKPAAEKAVVNLEKNTAEVEPIIVEKIPLSKSSSAETTEKIPEAAPVVKTVKVGDVLPSDSPNVKDPFKGMSTSADFQVMMDEADIEFHNMQRMARQYLLLLFIFYLFISFPIWMIAKRSLTTPAWLAWIPVVQYFLILRVAKRPAWFLLLIIFPPAFIVVTIILWMDVAKLTGKPRWIGALTLLPIMNFLIPWYFALTMPKSSLSVERIEPHEIGDLLKK